MNKRIIFMLLLLTAVALIGVQQALAFQGYMNTFNTTYNTTNTRIGTCIVCHDSIPVTAAPATNPYGVAVVNQDPGLGIGQRLANVEAFDSDGDGFINIDEIHNLTFPGNASDFPPTMPANFTFAADLTGSEEVPPVATFARGNATFNLSENGTVLQFKVTVANITNVTLSHIHLAPAGVNGSIVVNLFTGPTKTGRFDGVLAEGSITQADLIGPLAGLPLSALIENMTGGSTYVNVHTTQNPGGEIRGQIRAAPAPDARFSISGFKINGTIGNGIQGWNITLKNGTTDALIDSMPTDANGFYQFIVLVNGSYNVSEETRPGFTPVGATFQTETLSGQDVANVNFTNNVTIPPVNPPEITNWGNNKTNDTSLNITVNVPETVLFNATANQSIDTWNWFVDDVNQNNNLDNFSKHFDTAGTFTVKANATNANGTSNTVTWNVNVQAPPQPPQATFKISGFKINGTNNNGTGIPGWKIMLLNTTTQIEIANTTTDGTGFYNFSDVTNGTYNMTEEMKLGWTNISPTSQVIEINGSDVTDVNFTNQLVPPLPPQAAFNISGFKINGATGSGIEGWNITLMNETMQTTTATDANGFYIFQNLTNGTYNITEELKAGWMNTSPISQEVTINGADATNVNFTNTLIPVTPPATFNISGFKIDDTNGNGIWDQGEVGLENWNIILMNETTQMTATTDTNGFYQFTNLLQGTYTVREELKPDWTNTSPISRTVTITDMDIINVSFTNQRVPPPARSSISGFKINDLNGNERQDQGEEGLPGWTISLIGIVGSGAETSVIRMEATTDPDGFYKFDNLPPGRYILIERLERGFVPVSSPVKNIVLGQNENSMNNNFMNRPISNLIRLPSRVRDT